MSEQEAPNFEVSDITAAIGLLSRLPVRVNPEWAIERGGRGAWAYPVAGAMLGILAACVALVALMLGLSPQVTAGLTLVASAAMTGALHEDGLADAADGLWGGTTPKRRLEIMTDSRIGAYGVLALILITLLKWSALTTLIAHGNVLFTLLGVAALSRVPMVFLMNMMEPAKSTGLSHAQGKPEDTAVVSALGIAAIFGFICFGFGVIWIGVVVALAAFVVGKIAASKIGGQTGDILGATQQIAEAVILITLAAGL